MSFGRKYSPFDYFGAVDSGVPIALQDIVKRQPSISNSRDAALLLRGHISLEIEEFWVLALGPTQRLLKKQCLFRGTVDECVVHPREILRFGIMARASGLILAHSHPSGECFPSEQDLHFTQRAISACELIQIPMLDHLILTKISHFSFADRLWQ